MHSNHTYNLMHQLLVEQKSLWRIQNYYKVDAENCDECQQLWEKMRVDKEDHIEEITGLLKGHMEQLI